MAVLRRRVLSTSAFLALAFSLSVLIAGCGKKKDSPGALGLSTKNSVVVWIISDITRLNPYTTQDADGQYVAGQIWEALNAQNPRTQEDIPALASLPEVSADHLIYTYTMDPRAQWSDGKPVTSADVIFSFKAVLNPLVVNGTGLRSNFGYLDSVYCPNGDQTKVQFHLKQASWQAKTQLGGGYVQILPKHVLDPKGLTDKYNFVEVKDANPKNPAIQEFATWFESNEIARDPKYQVGSGPYMFDKWVTNDRIILKRNPKYWAQDVQWHEAYPDELTYKTISDQNAALVSLKAKDIDILQTMKPEQYFSQVDTVKTPWVHKDTVYYNNISFIAWNNDRAMFKDKNVRKALTMLINRDDIIKNLFRGYAVKMESPIHFTQPNFNPAVKQPEYNVAEAKRLLTEAGWTDSDGDGILDKSINGVKTPFKFTFQTNSANETRKQVLLIISEQLRKVGITADVNAPEATVFTDNILTHKFDACYWAWAGNATESDPYALWHSSASKNKGHNFMSFMSPESDKLLEQMRGEFDEKARWEMGKKWQEVFAQDQPVTFLWSSPLYLGVLKRFDNLEWFHQRPCFEPHFWIVRGSNVKRTANGAVMQSPY